MYLLRKCDWTNTRMPLFYTWGVYWNSGGLIKYLNWTILLRIIMKIVIVLYDKNVNHLISLLHNLQCVIKLSVRCVRKCVIRGREAPVKHHGSCNTSILASLFMLQINMKQNLSRTSLLTEWKKFTAYKFLLHKKSNTYALVHSVHVAIGRHRNKAVLWYSGYMFSKPSIVEWS